MDDTYEQFRYQCQQQNAYSSTQDFEDLLKKIYKNEPWRPIFDQCVKDAQEYFPALKIDISTKVARMQLTKEQKERVVAFLKARKDYYSEYGLLI